MCYKSNGVVETAFPKLAFFSAFGSRPAVYGLPCALGQERHGQPRACCPRTKRPGAAQRQEHGRAFVTYTPTTRPRSRIESETRDLDRTLST